MAAIVVDFGSSIVVDVVSAKGSSWAGRSHRGGVASDAAAARSRAAPGGTDPPRSVIGKNTVECMQSGAVFGFAGLVDGLIRRIRDTLADTGTGGEVSVVTGHAAPMMLPELQTAARFERYLTLDGLRLVFERNRDQRPRR